MLLPGIAGGMLGLWGFRAEAAGRRGANVGTQRLRARAARLTMSPFPGLTGDERREDRCHDWVHSLFTSTLVKYPRLGAGSAKARVDIGVTT